MLKHIVVWQFKEWAEGRSKRENLELAQALLETLPASVPAIRHLEAGLNIVDTDASYDLALLVDVDDRRALNDYLNHPSHQAVSARIAPLCESRVCVDKENRQK